MQMLLLTSSANETISSVLAGNETMTEGDLNKMRTEIAQAWMKMETLVEGMYQALQRAAVVFEEVKGCCLWAEQYRPFFPKDQGPVIDSILRTITSSQPQTLSLIRHIQQETRCWAHFYKWWKYERARQEAIRDQAEEPKTDISYDVLLLADFFKRGFVDYALEKQIGITLDKKTRGTFVEDDEDEDDERDEEKGKVREESDTIEEDDDTAITDAGTGDSILYSKEEDSQPWHSRPSFLNHLKEVKAKLQELPDRERLRKSNAPSSRDVHALASTPFIHTGPCKGLFERQEHGSKAKKPVDMLRSIKEALQQSSTLFSNAFSHYAQPCRASDENEMRLRHAPAAFRPDALQSVARIASQSGSSHQEDGGDLQALRRAKCVMNEAKGLQWLLSIGCDEQSQRLVLRIVKHDCVNKTGESISIRCDGQIVDAGFYSNQEVVVLLRHDDAQREDSNSMASFRLDSLTFSHDRANVMDEKSIPVQRHYELDLNQVGRGATQLSLNQAKDVAATLNSEGNLVYWDLVLLGEGDEEDQEMG
ncbi:hypothetical protein CBS101457_002799 [Exobasidium rhododendri]|nr:hypothetical protein CBS101457_002799 [Exobasidium rhododendri]